MLFQIQRRLANLQAARSQPVKTENQATKDTDQVDGSKPKKISKTIGVEVEPKLYVALDRLRTKRGLRSLKAAMILAAEEGLKHLV
jgi:hypothetical protein